MKLVVLVGAQHATLVASLVPDAFPESPLGKAAEDCYQLLLSGIADGGRSGKFGSATAVWAQLHGLVMLKADGFVAPPLDTLVAELVL